MAKHSRPAREISPGRRESHYRGSRFQLADWDLQEKRAHPPTGEGNKSGCGNLSDSVLLKHYQGLLCSGPLATGGRATENKISQ